jgi:muramoyltetrapeptide carboxypeptidase
MPISPSFLKPGDKVLIIATARKISSEEVENTSNLLKSWEYEVELGPNLLKEHHQYSGTDDERAADLQWALDHPTAGAILIARGGYGTLKIIDRVLFGRFIGRPKWICGYSDVTVLHSHLHRIGYRSLHCTMVNQFLRHREATLNVRKLLSGEDLRYETVGHRLNRAGSAEGELVGGNLSVLYALCGSSSAMNLSNKILFIEDIDEYLYHIDRMMMQLKRSGRLERLAGFVVGGMTDMKDNAIPFGQTAEEIIADVVKEYGYPVAFNFPAGHQDENLPFIHGKRMKLNVTSSGTTLE